MRRLREIDRRRRRDLLLVLDREVRLRLVAEDHRGEILREAAHERVVVLHRLDVAVARDGDAVLGAFELRLQILEEPVGLELRIVLADRHQARQRTRKLALRLLDFRDRGRVVELVGADRDLADVRARLGDFREDLFLVRRVTFHGVDEIRHEIRAALILVDDLGPRRLDSLVLGLDRVVAAARHEADENEQERKLEQPHGMFLPTIRDDTVEIDELVSKG